MSAFLLTVAMFTQCEECPPGPWKVAVFGLSGVGVEKELATTISELLRFELSECEEYIVMDKETMIDSLDGDLWVSGTDDAVEQSEMLGVFICCDWTY